MVPQVLGLIKQHKKLSKIKTPLMQSGVQVPPDMVLAIDLEWDMKYCVQLLNLKANL